MSTDTRIAQLCTERQWLQTRLAQKVRINVKSVKDWENDVSLSTITSVKKLRTLFHITSDYLLELDDRPIIVLERLSPEKVTRARKIMQLFIDTSPKT